MKINDTEDVLLYKSQQFVLYNVFTPTHNTVDLSMHGSKKEHTNVYKCMKEHKVRYVAVVEKHALDGINTITHS